MNKPVPHITIEQVLALFDPIGVNATVAEFNRRIDAYNKANEQPLITAEEARKLGAGKVEFFGEDEQRWFECDVGCRYIASIYGKPVKYRAIKQPEPVEPVKLKCGGGKEGSDYCSWCGGAMWMNVPEVCPVRARDSLQKQKEKMEVLAFGCQLESPNTTHCEKWCGLSNCIVAFKAPTAPVEPHAELKAMHEQQVKGGTLDNFVWEFKNSGREFITLVGVEPFFCASKTYRCTPKPTCQVRNLDTDELKTITREAAQKLQAELGDMVEWWLSGVGCVSNSGLNFEMEGIYTYKLRGTVKLTIDGEAKLYTPAQCEAERLARIDTHDVAYYQAGVDRGLRLIPLWVQYEPKTAPEYRLIRKQPKLIPLDWENVPVGVAVRDKETGVIWVYMGSNELEAILVNIPSRPFGSRFIELANIELAPASEQLWIAVQDSMSTVDLINGLGKAGLICELHLLRYRIKRLADGYCYPEQKGGC